MSDSRFARLKTDPRFRRIRKKESKVVVDERFKGIFDDKKKKGKGKEKRQVDKYGRPLSDTHEQDNLRRFYRLEGEGGEPEESLKQPDYARGEVLLESSDEDEDAKPSDDDSDAEGIVILGQDSSRPIPVPDELEIDLDEDHFADLDAQAAEYAKVHDKDGQVPEGDRTRRLAVVNLDWDHVRAIHLYKIFSSLVSPTASAVPSALISSVGRGSNKMTKGATPRVMRGKILSVRIYPSEFGKERMAREEKEGPPPEIFKKKESYEEVNEKNIYEVGDADTDYNEDALRKYQLERLRYYYAIVECDTVDTASHIYSELEGTELERSANVFDLSFVPDGMAFDEEPRDEATQDVGGNYKALEFTTDALRHSKVKLTWDDDDPERHQITRRTLTRKEIEENDFRAYLASDSEEEVEDSKDPQSKESRDKLRALLLGGGDDALPEGWGKGDEDDIDMEITFTPGLSESKNPDEETTLEKYQRKMKEKRKKRKEERKGDQKEIHVASEKTKVNTLPGDEFFENGSSEEEDKGEEQRQKERGKKSKEQKGQLQGEAAPRVESTAEELALIAASDNPSAEPKHFDMKAVIKAEKAKGKKRRGKKGKHAAEEENELQEDFVIDVKDERFNAVHEDHTFAIDPSNPHFKKTKSMTALLDERGKRQKEGVKGHDTDPPPKSREVDDSQPELRSLVESVKRKSAAAGERSQGKRRRL